MKKLTALAFITCAALFSGYSSASITSTACPSGDVFIEVITSDNLSSTAELKVDNVSSSTIKHRLENEIYGELPLGYTCDNISSGTVTVVDGATTHSE